MFVVGIILVIVGIVIPIVILFSGDSRSILLALFLFIVFIGTATFLIIRDKSGEIEHKMVMEYVSNNIPADIKNPNKIVMDVYTGFKSTFNDDEDQGYEILTKSMYRIQKWEKINSRKYGITGEGTYYILVGKYNE